MLIWFLYSFLQFIMHVFYLKPLQNYFKLKKEFKIIVKNLPRAIMNWESFLLIDSSTLVSCVAFPFEFDARALVPGMPLVESVAPHPTSRNQASLLKQYIPNIW